MRPQRLAVVFAVIAALACDKPNDLPRMQDELLASALSYRSRFDELKRRADAVEPRVRALPQDTGAAAAQHTLGLARTAIDHGLGHLQQVPTLLQAWVKSDNPRQLLRGWLDGKRRELEAGAIEAGSELAAVESWTAGAEQRAGGPQPPAAAPPPAEPAPEDREPQADGSGAPIR